MPYKKTFIPKTNAAPKTTDSKTVSTEAAQIPKTAESKTVNPETAQMPKTQASAKAATPASALADAADQSRLARETLISFRQTMYSSKMLGSADELIPFAWRNPLKPKNIKKTSKYLRNQILAEEERNKTNK